jgi:class 3 adenylate cyclase
MPDTKAGKKAPQSGRAVPLGVMQYALEIKREASQRLSKHIARHMCDEAAERLLKGESPSELFQRKSFMAFVVSLDLRHSTDMMMFAKDANNFAAFIRSAFDELACIIKAHFGVIEKFTGDGLLAYFPVDFSGVHAGYRAVKACDEAVKFFTRHYERCRSSFTCVLEDFGLSAGIDFGEVQLREITETPSLLGKPVVFACRLSSGPCGNVLVNQSAYDHLQESCPGGVCFENASLEVKHLGTLACYQVKNQDIAFPLTNPDWYEGTPPAND